MHGYSKPSRRRLPGGYRASFMPSCCLRTGSTSLRDALAGSGLMRFCSAAGVLSASASGDELVLSPLELYNPCLAWTAMPRRLIRLLRLTPPGSTGRDRRLRQRRSCCGTDLSPCAGRGAGMKAAPLGQRHHGRRVDFLRERGASFLTDTASQRRACRHGAGALDGVARGLVMCVGSRHRALVKISPADHTVPARFFFHASTRVSRRCCRRGARTLRFSVPGPHDPRRHSRISCSPLWGILFAIWRSDAPRLPLRESWVVRRLEIVGSGWRAFVGDSVASSTHSAPPRSSSFTRGADAQTTTRRDTPPYPLYLFGSASRETFPRWHHQGEYFADYLAV